MASSKSDRDSPPSQRGLSPFIWLVRSGLLVLALAGAGNALGLWDFHGAILGLPHLCPVHALTGHDCPGCGMGRSLALLTQGRVVASLHQHPFGLPFLLWMIGWGVLPERWLLRLQRWPLLRSDVLPTTAVAFVLLWWLVTKVA